MRTRQLAIEAEPVYYIAHVWSCSVCGENWVDESLESLNASAEQSALSHARRAS